VAIVITAAAFVGIAWLVTGIAIPPDAPTARVYWLQPFRVIATLGFAISGFLHLPHVIGQLLAAIALGGALGAVFAVVRRVLR
jgi:hypothetical protein